MKVGKAKYGGNKKKYFKLKDGDSIFRILPPLGELADDGKWSLFYKVHYGYKNPAGKNRAFQSSLEINRKTKMVEVPDAAQERIDKLKGELEKAKASKDKTKIDGLLKFVGAPKSMYNCDSNHYMNAIDEQGNIGVLKLRHRAKLALDATIKSLRDKNIDPLSADNGRFFVFRRSGNALETTFQVEVYRKTENIKDVGEVQREVVHQLTDDIIARLKNEAAELQKLFKKPTSEEITQIVTESDIKTGTSPNIDDILGFTTENTETAEEQIEEEPEDEVTETQATLPKEEPKVAAKVGPEPEATKTNKVKAETKTEKKETVALPSTTSEKISEMSDKDFLASVGILD